MTLLDSDDCHHFVLLQHGVLGTPADFSRLIRYIFLENERRCSVDPEKYMDGVSLEQMALPRDVSCTKNEDGGRLFVKGNLTCFAPGSNGLAATYCGTRSCANRTLREFLPVIMEWLRDVDGKGVRNRPVCFSALGHSFGGIILRDFLYLLLVSEDDAEFDNGLLHGALDVRRGFANLNVTLENFITVATPHCGVAQCLFSPIYYGACALAMTCASSLNELLLKDRAAVLSKRLVSKRHLSALRHFRRRTLFANTEKDILVGFSTSSLLCDDVREKKDSVLSGGTDGLLYAAAFSNDRSAYSTVILLPPLSEKRRMIMGESSSSTTPTHTLNELREESEDGSKEKDDNEPCAAFPSQEAIAAALRTELEWRVVALRHTFPLPTAHWGCVGMLSKYAAEPEIVRRIAQEVVSQH